LDASATILAEWHVDARHVAGAIELLTQAPWPNGAVRMRVLDAEGRDVNWPVKVAERRRAR
jgi:hypothetical protein